MGEWRSTEGLHPLQRGGQAQRSSATRSGPWSILYRGMDLTSKFPY
jgi:hypothetical protein